MGMNKKPKKDGYLEYLTPSIRVRATHTGRLLNTDKKERQQEKRLKQAQLDVLRSPDEPRSHLLLAWHLAENNQIQDAILAWTKGHLLLPFDEDVNVEEDEWQAQMNALSHDVFGDILLRSGAVDQACEEWKKASALDKYGIGDQARRKLQEHPGVSKTE